MNADKRGLALLTLPSGTAIFISTITAALLPLTATSLLFSSRTLLIGLPVLPVIPKSAFQYKFFDFEIW